MFAISLLVALAAAPATARDPQPSETLPTGHWRAWLDCPGGELPFGLELRAADGGWEAALINGPERIQIPTVAFEAGRLSLGMDHYDSEITAELSPDGRRLDGMWEKRRGADRVSRLAFHAAHGDAPRFALTGAPSPELAGRWQVKFESSEDLAVGVFRSGDSPDVLLGTFLTTTGDYRYLAGVAAGNELALSCFDGAHAFLFRAKSAGDGTLTGDFWSRDTWHETWSAERSAAAAVADPFQQTKWDESISLAGLVFSDLEGQPRSLGDPAYAGRARILQIFGSWCPNCHDEAKFLSDFERRYRDRGLSVIGIAFELTGGFERDAEQVRRFAERHKLEYPLLIAGVADKSLATQAFGALDRVRSFPTTVFLRADGQVHSVHSGFTGPGTGEAYEEVQREFADLVEQLLATEPHADDTWDWLTSSTWSRRALRSGDTMRFNVADGERMADSMRFGTRPGENRRKREPARLVPGGVAVGSKVLRIDRAAGVLLDPVDFGLRWSSDPNNDTPLIPRGTASEREARLEEYLEDDDPRLRREALFALANDRRNQRKMGFDGAVAYLADPAPEVRATAAWACGATQELDAIPALAELLESAAPAPRREAARALIRLAKADLTAAEILAPYADDLDPIVRALAQGR